MIKYFGIGSFILYGLLVLILVINEKKKSSIIKYCFFGLFFLASVVFLYFNQELIDYILRIGIRYLYYPSFNSYLVTLFLALVIFLYSILSEKMNKKIKIVNYIFASLLIVTYVIFMMLNIDIYSYNSLYSGVGLICIKYSVRGFVLWLLTVFVIKYCQYFFGKR